MESTASIFCWPGIFSRAARRRWPARRWGHALPTPAPRSRPWTRSNLAGVKMLTPQRTPSIARSSIGSEGGRDASRIKSGSGVARVLRNGRALRDWGFRLGRSPGDAPPGSVYLNATQFLLDRPWYVRWLASRPDVKPVAFVHDLLPLDHPEFFQPREAALHPRRNRNICRLAAGVVVASQTVARRFEAYADENGRKDLAHLRRETAGRACFRAADRCARGACRGRLFRRLRDHRAAQESPAAAQCLARARRERSPAPKLVLVGKRGWLNENVVDMLTSHARRCAACDRGGRAVDAGPAPADGGARARCSCPPSARASACRSPRR